MMQSYSTAQRGVYCSGCGHLNPSGHSHCEQCLTPLVSPDELRRSGPLRATGVMASYAGFWKRLAAFIVDSFVLAAAGAVLGVCYGLMFVAQGIDDGSALQCVGYVIGAVIGWIYYAAMESSPKQATLGKMALGVKVTDLEGQPISFGRASARFLGRYVSSLLLGIGFLMVAFTERKQALHDMMAGCLVVDR